MKVLMFGWEFPPFASGGLGTACYGLTKGMAAQNVEVTFVVPRAPENASAEFVKLIGALDIKKVKIRAVDSILVPYISSQGYEKELIKYNKSGMSSVYGKNLYEEVNRYAEIAKLIALSEDFDIIHCHDWMTYRAGIAAKKATGKKLVCHIHATEFDRTGDHPNQYIYDIEREGLHAADMVIAVSNFTKNKVIEHYGVPPEKIAVVHNAVEFTDYNENDNFKLKEHNKIVLFLGRVTLQKGPDYFIYAAKKVLEVDPDVRFVIAGSGDMEPFIMHKVAEMGIADKVLFTGFLKGKDIDRAYKMADVYVMPSVSEPFGITPLEAMRNGTPVIISKQSGVSEVISHCLKVDFWDINELANKILAVLNYKPLHESLKYNGMSEVKKFDWNEPARKCIDVYRSLGCA